MSIPLTTRLFLAASCLMAAGAANGQGSGPGPQLRLPPIITPGPPRPPVRGAPGPVAAAGLPLLAAAAVASAMMGRRRRRDD